MTGLVVAAQIGSAIAAFLAAWYWFASAQEKTPPRTFGGIGELPDWLDRASAKNRRAALCAGVSALLAALATLISAASH